MAYALNKSDNGLLITLEDGVVDTSTTSLTLIGRNAPTFGERQNENFIRLLENFARATAPGSNVGDAVGPPMVGQLWYNVTTKQINVYTGSGADNGWKSLGGFVKGLSTDTVANLKQGDFYYATDTETLSIHNGTGLDFVGPINVRDGVGKLFAGNTRLTAERLTKTPSGTAAVVSLYVDGERLAVFNKGLEFTTAVSGFATVGQGITLNSTLANPRFTGTATNSDSLGGSAAATFARLTAANNTFAGNLYITDNGGLSVGTTQQTDYSFSPTQVTSSGTLNNGVLTNNVEAGSWVIRTKKNGSWRNSIVINGDSGAVTINGSLSVTDPQGGAFNADTASKWATPRTINVTGIGTGSVAIDGSQDVTLNITPAYAGVDRTGDTMTGGLTLPGNGLVVGSQLRVSNGKIGVNASDPAVSLDINGALRSRIKEDYGTSGAISIDCAASNNHLVNLVGNATFTLANFEIGQVVRVTVTGSNNAISWATAVRWPYGVAPDLSVGPTDTAVVTFHKPSASFILATYVIY